VRSCSRHYVITWRLMWLLFEVEDSFYEETRKDSFFCKGNKLKYIVLLGKNYLTLNRVLCYRN